MKRCENDSCTHARTQSARLSFPFTYTQWDVHCIRSLTHSLTHSFTPSLTASLTASLTHCLTHSLPHLHPLLVHVHAKASACCGSPRHNGGERAEGNGQGLDPRVNATQGKHKGHKSWREEERGGVKAGRPAGDRQTKEGVAAMRFVSSRENQKGTHVCS